MEQHPNLTLHRTDIAEKKVKMNDVANSLKIFE